MDPANDSDGHGATAAAGAPESEKPSCHGCRKRKLKCSRELPTCAHCRRLGAPCVYDDKKNKPGLKSGAIEGLSRRIEVLENAVLKGDGFLQRWDAGGATGEAAQDGNGGPPGGVLNLLSTLCMELCKHNASLRQGQPALRNGSTASPETPEGVTRPLGAPTTSHSNAWERRGYAASHDPSLTAHSPHARKRRRLDSCGNPSIELRLPLQEADDAQLSCLPPPDLLEDIVTVYFATIQPWIPILHETRFRARMRDPEQLPSLLVVLHGMVVSAIRFTHADAHGLSHKDVEALVTKSRNLVVLNAMDSLAVENLQGLIMIAFTDIGNGDASRAWSIVGSLTRTVEYLQLTVEPVKNDTEPLLKPTVSLRPAQTWVEEEERRRVFWNIFNLDRFCSVATGWNTSLTADDVHRRLPADGGGWHKNEQVTTPYFGIWDRSNAKIGNSIAFLPADYSGPDQTQAQSTAPQPSVLSQSHSATGRASVPPDMSTVGAFAYCIEATESLSRVTTFFLQQRINFHDRREVSSWLTRFKELDLRLVHWKMFLPRQWKDSNVSRQPEVVEMDPNLTMAHATHNTSMILLHQRVAYPPADWANIVRLPSVWSADTCQNAAIETQNITAKYLKYTPKNSPVAHQFAFCAFVAARVLLVHWRYYGHELPEALWLLVDSLDEMARRWRGPLDNQWHNSSPDQRRRRCLAETYADHLRDLHQRCVADANFSVDVLGYSTVISSNSCLPSQSQQPLDQAQNQAGGYTAPHSVGNSNGLGPLLDPPAPQGLHYAGAQAIAPGSAQPAQYGTPTDDELSNISYMLLDQRFLDMDRVISLDNMIFSTAMGSTAHTMDDGGMPLNGNGGYQD